MVRAKNDMVKKMEWGQGFFDEEMCKTLFTDRILEHAKKECDFIEDVLDIPKGSKILDVGCGIGRHAVELAKRGYKPTGLDYSSTFLKKGKIYAKKEGVDIKFIERDMRSLPFKEEFDAVINMCTSFGYFEEEKDHLEVLRGIAHADWDKIDDIFVLKEKELDLEHNRINGKWVFIEGEKRKE
jgi:cyclopropane fatty-acyl-phospholipid synthase-like methyltransferase